MIRQRKLRQRVGAALLAAAVLAGAGCARHAEPPRGSPHGRDRFPVSGTELREGDILLAYGDSLISLLIAKYGLPPGRYSHSGMYYRDESGRGRVLSIAGRGLESESPAAFFGHSSRLALVRLKDRADTTPLGEKARWLWQRNRTEPLRFDMAWRKDTEELGAFFCDELISYIYCQCGLPDPFVQSAEATPSGWTRRMKELTGIDLVATVSPNAALDAPDFVTIQEIERDRPPEVRTLVMDTILDRIRRYVGQEGYLPRKPSLGSRMLFALERYVWKRELIRRLPDPNQRQVWYSVLEYIADCRAATVKLLRTRWEEPWSDQRIRALVERVCDAYRDRHFRKAEAAAGKAEP